MSERLIRILKAQNVAKTPYIAVYANEGAVLRIGVDIVPESAEILLQSGAAELVGDKETATMPSEGKVKSTVRNGKKA